MTDNLEEGLILPVDKPYRWTSTDVVSKVKVLLRRIGYRKIKVGHAGTLDPLATGVLLICIGKATKRAEELQNEEKEYLAGIQLGATTPSYDLEHPIDETFAYDHIDREMIDEALGGFIGEQQQIPPIYSAKQIDGKRAYDYAREGLEVKMRVATINIYEASVVSCDLPNVEIALRCSKGTYVRSFARDLGERVASGGHLTSLRRTRSGGYKAEECYTIEQVEKMFAQTNLSGETDAAD